MENDNKHLRRALSVKQTDINKLNKKISKLESIIETFMEGAAQKEQKTLPKKPILNQYAQETKKWNHEEVKEEIKSQPAFNQRAVPKFLLGSK